MKLHPAILGFLCACGAATASNGQERGRERSPNVVVVFTDDQGYADVGCFGAEGYSTPNIDRLAEDGVRLTNFHVAQPVCSASRAALLTGCYPNRIGIHGALGPDARHGIHVAEVTLAEVLKQRGYATAAFGKWHLGHLPPFLPTRHGFDEYFGLPYSNDMWPFHPTAGERYPSLPLLDGEAVVAWNPDQTQLTRRYTERAVRFIDAHHAEPFFLYLAHSMPHVPLYASQRFAGTTKRGRYGDVIAEIDWSVGQVVEALARHGVYDDTLLVFASDNGPWLSYGDHAGSARPLREGKGTAWEGGVRVPCVMAWPRRLPAGRVCHDVAMTIDLLPTVAGLVGAELPEHRIDGRDIWPLLSGVEGARSPAEAAYFFYYKRNELHAVLSGRWKLYFPHEYRSLGGRPGGTGGEPVPYDSRPVTSVELYDLLEDVSETTDVAAHQPEVVERLVALGDRARGELGDSLRQQSGSGTRAAGRPAPDADAEVAR